MLTPGAAWSTLRAPVDAGDSRAVVADRSDDPSDVRAVPVVVVRVVVVAHEVPAAPVVDVAVAVVVEPVGAAAGTVLAGVDPEVPRQVGMRHVEAGVENPDHDIGTATRDSPGFLGVDVIVGRAGSAVDGLAE